MRAGSFAAGRFVAALSQLALAAVATRVLSDVDLGRFTVAFTVANLASIVFGSSVRRLALYREEGEDAADIRAAVLVGTATTAVGAAVVSAAVADLRTAMIAWTLALWKAADSYAEIAQAEWARTRRLDRAGLALGMRTAGSTLLAAVLLGSVGVIPALVAGLGVRCVAAWSEQRLAGVLAVTRPDRASIGRVLRYGSIVSLPGVAIALVDTLPTLATTRAAGLEEAALLTPLGRIRFGLILIATTLGEVFYADMADAARRHSGMTRILARTSASYALLVVPATAVLALGGAAVVFGDRLVGRSSLVAAACAAGAVMGLANLTSLGLTAQRRLRVQTAAYAGAAVVAVAGSWIGGWTIAAMFLSQAAGTALALAVVLPALLERPKAAAPSSVPD
jgi:O-antigen/teichoic acid export membrane protein